MDHEALINRLTKDLKPVRRRHLGAEVVIVALICAIELGLFFGLGFNRPDMPVMMKQPAFWWRLGSLGIISLASSSLALLSFNPAYAPRRGSLWLALIIALALIFGLYINAAPGAFAAIIHRIDWRDGVLCAGKIIALSVPPLIGLGMLMRQGAPTDTAATALLIGLASASWGAFIFVFACPFDDPLYIAVWYSAGCGAVTLLSRIILPRLARW